MIHQCVVAISMLDIKPNNHDIIINLNVSNSYLESPVNFFNLMWKAMTLDFTARLVIGNNEVLVVDVFQALNRYYVFKMHDNIIVIIFYSLQYSMNVRRFL